MSSNSTGNWSNIKARYLSDLQNRDHNVLDGRDALYAHPVSAIDGIPSIPFISVVDANTYAFTLYTNFASVSDSFTEADIQYKIEQRGTLGRLRVFIKSNFLNKDLVITIRKNGSNTPVTLTVGAGLTGEFVDDIHTVDVVKGDLVNYSEATLDLVDTADFGIIQCQFVPT